MSLRPALAVSDWLFLSGQGALDDDNKIVGDTIEEQTEVTLRERRAAPSRPAATNSPTWSALVHLADLDDFAGYNAVYERHFPDPKPVRTTVGARLLRGLLVEITVTAHRQQA